MQYPVNSPQDLIEELEMRYFLGKTHHLILKLKLDYIFQEKSNKGILPNNLGSVLIMWSLVLVSKLVTTILCSSHYNLHLILAV
jgi:hypothetical protein